MPKDADQRVLWPSTVTLSADYFASLQQHAVPLDPRAIAALAGSALALDVYVWLAQRLHRISRQAADDHMAGAQGSVWGGVCRTAHLGMPSSAAAKIYSNDALFGPIPVGFRVVQPLIANMAWKYGVQVRMHAMFPR